ncbi:hypothetical protein [Mesonia aquimarina]|uniref:hypothetical protein n=1 Tax=Mesonia aquimarina TaxID=1504967 RepID=UPI000EF5D41A|nr:hypothetical protein [Mesonia aquimarina]
MPQLIIQRKKEITNGFLSLHILLNGKKIGSIENGEHKKWTIQPGHYTLKAKGGILLGSQEISLKVKEGENKMFQLGNFGGGYFKTHLQLKEMES